MASRTDASAKAFAERFGIPRAYGSWAELAADDEVDVVYVATPHSAHRAATGLCLEAGKHVLCEKAFTLNSREAEELVALARDRGLFLMEAMWTYCNPVIRRLTALVADGAIGEIRTVQADFGLAGPFAPDHRLRDPALGGGALLDLGVYPVSFAQLLLGEPDRIQADALLSPEGVDLNTGMLLGWEIGRHGAAQLLAGRGHPADRLDHGHPGPDRLPARLLLPGAVRTAPRRDTTRRSSPRGRRARALSGMQFEAGRGGARPAGGRDGVAAGAAGRFAGGDADARCGTGPHRRPLPRGRHRLSGTEAGLHAGVRPWLPTSVTNDPAVATGAPGVVTADTVRKSARAWSWPSVTTAYPRRPL